MPAWEESAPGEHPLGGCWAKPNRQASDTEAQPCCLLVPALFDTKELRIKDPRILS